MNVNSIEKYFIWLMIYSIIGWIYESMLCSIREKRYVNRGFLNGPYCPIYGCGAVLVILFLSRFYNPIQLFLLGAIVTCTLEYLTSYVMEKIFHARWWDYSNRRFHIGGRVCLIGGIVFGAFSVALVLFIHPRIITYTSLIPNYILHIITVVLLLVFLTDIIITIIGFTGFSELLKEFSVLLEQKKEDATEKIRSLVVYSTLKMKLSRQQRRMIDSFPNLRTIKHNDILLELRAFINMRKKDK